MWRTRSRQVGNLFLTFIFHSSHELLCTGRASTTEQYEFPVRSSTSSRGRTLIVHVVSPAATKEVVNDTPTVTAANPTNLNLFFAGTKIVLVGPVWPRGQKKQKSANSYLLFINYDRTTFSIGMDRNIAFVFYKLSCPAPPIIFRASFKTHIYTPSYSQSLSLLPNDLLNRYGSEEFFKVIMSSYIK